jgi:acetoin utilization deacetylase AcuC-like enzyme
MTTALISHHNCANHVTPDGHPEQVARFTRVLDALNAEEFADLVRVEAPLVSDEQILRAHSQAYLNTINASAPENEGVLVPIDGDTWMSFGSLTAARRAAGGVVKAVDMVLGGTVQSAFCAVRPPGHHAERDRAMGFCFFSSVAIGALHALEAHGLDRVAIVDFDVHHGNGTQDIAWSDPRILFASSHEWPLYPGTGHPNETGSAHNIVNATLSAGATGAALEAVFADVILPAVDAHRPELIFISAGFDAHAADPLATLRLTEHDFARATDAICALAAKHCRGRVISSLEGGYDLAALGCSTAAHVASLMSAKREE